jgi:hypothetical protein
VRCAVLCCAVRDPNTCSVGGSRHGCAVVRAAADIRVLTARRGVAFHSAFGCAVSAAAAVSDSLAHRRSE